MSKGIRNALKKIDQMIEGVTPKTDSYHGFVSINSRNGSVNLLDATTSNTRFFDISAVSIGGDGGLSGLSSNKIASFEVRVRYDIPSNPVDRSIVMFEDSVLLSNAIKGPNYDLATTGIINCYFETPPRTQPLLSQTGETVADFLIIPFIMIYLEESV